MGAPYLHLIQYHAEPPHEDAFDRWYNHHILNVLQQPGYGWCSRYVSLGGTGQGPDIRNLTLYIVTDRAGFDVVLSPDLKSRPPALKEDQETIKKLEGVRYVHSGIFEQTAGSHLGKPLLVGNRPVLLVLTDVATGKEDTWNQWVVEEEIPALLQDPMIAMAGHFRAVGGILPPWLVQGPRYLTLYEMATVEAAHALSHEAEMSPATRRLITSPAYKRSAAMTKRQWRLVYKPVSQHWSYWKAGKVG